MIRIEVDFAGMGDDLSFRWPREAVEHAGSLRPGTPVDLHDDAGTTARGVCLGSGGRGQVVVKVVAGSFGHREAADA